MAYWKIENKVFFAWLVKFMPTFVIHTSRSWHKLLSPLKNMGLKNFFIFLIGHSKLKIGIKKLGFYFTRIGR